MVREKYVKQEVEKKVFVRVSKKERFKRKLEDIWYYHKLSLALILVGTIALSLIIAKFIPDKKPDITILLVTSKEWKNDDYILMMREIIGIYMGDTTGDSRVNVAIKQYVMDSNNPDSDAIKAFDEEVAAKENYMVICDKANARWLSANGYLLYTDDAGMFGDYKLNDYAVDWKICGLIESDYYLSQLQDSLYFCTLKYETTGPSNEDDAISAIDEDEAVSIAEALYDCLIRSAIYNENYADAIREYQKECWKTKPDLGSPYEK